MTDEETRFEEWFHRQRREDFERLPDYGRFEDHPNWGMGSYRAMKKAWIARGALDSTSGLCSNSPID